MMAGAPGASSQSASRDRSRSTSPKLRGMSMDTSSIPRSAGTVTPTVNRAPASHLSPSHLRDPGSMPGAAVTSSTMPPNTPFAPAALTTALRTALPQNAALSSPSSGIPGQAFSRPAGSNTINNGQGTAVPQRLQSGSGRPAGPALPSVVTPRTISSTQPETLVDQESGLHGDGAEAGAGKVAAFLNKLFSMINDSQTDALIYWAADGKSFFIPNSQEFGRQLLPQFFKHANFTSFVRQLNMYGFKKVPHLQAGALTTIPSTSKAPQAANTTELWEFSNPKFMRSRPELLASITRKRSAKEVAAAQALSISSGGAVKKEDILDEMDVDGNGVDLAARQIGSSSTGRNRQPDPNTSLVDPQALNKALALMHSTHTAMEKEIASLKSSNEMLWRQAMVAQKEQAESQKRLEGVVNFLANKFGGMGVVGASIGEGVGKSAGVSKLPGRVSRGRLIGDGINGLAGSDDEDGMDQDELWENGDPDEGKFWELDEKGNEVQRQAPRNTPVRPGTSRALTTPSRINFPSLHHIAGNDQASDSSPQRFENLETSPETDIVASFDGSSDANMSTPMMDSPQTAETGHHKGQLLFSPVPRENAIASSSRQTLPAHADHTNAGSVQHQASDMVPYTGNNPPFVLEDSILQMPLGTLLSNPAGAQLLATLGSLGMSAHGSANTVQANGIITPNGLHQANAQASGTLGIGQSPRMTDYLDLRAAEDDGDTSANIIAADSHGSTPDLINDYVNAADWLGKPPDPSESAALSGADADYGLISDPAFASGESQPTWSSDEIADFLAMMGGNEGAYQYPSGGDALDDNRFFNDMIVGADDPTTLNPEHNPLLGPVDASEGDGVEGMPGQAKKKRKTDQR